MIALAELKNMYDAAWSFTRRVLIPIGNFANEVRRLPEEVQKMKDERERIQTIIYKTCRMSAPEKEDKKKVKRMLEIVFRLEDIIDKYTTTEQWLSVARDRPFAALPSKVAAFIKSMSIRLLVLGKLKFFEWQETRAGSSGGLLVSSISEPQGPGPSRTSDENQDASLQNLQDAARSQEEAQVVGFESRKQKLINLLVHGRKELTTIFVEAMRGAGKTTLANLVFKNQQVIDYFEGYRVWITVPESYIVEELLRKILRAFYEEQKNTPPEAISTMDRESLKNEVKNYLREKRYVIFFDNVLNTNFGKDVELALIDNECGSRVFIMTTEHEVITPCQNFSFVEEQKLQPLDEKESRELFDKKAFHDKNERCPQYLVPISSQILNKCNGLPLAIVVIGGALAGVTDLRVWHDFNRDLNSELRRDSGSDAIEKILGFSCDVLPPHLKPCLLYFGMYPENYEVRSERMISQWIAEGFVKEEMGKSLERVAERYLRELVNKNLVQASLTVYGRVKRCHVHGLIRDMILKKFKDLSFCQFVSVDHSALRVESRRLSIARGYNDFMVRTESSNIRSLLLFIEEHFPLVFMRAIIARYKMMKVLDFEGFGLNCGIPKNLGTLVLLKYLSFRNTCITKLPKSIGELKNLETLDIRETKVKVLPKETGNLTKLRHFLFSSEVDFTPLLDSVGRMTSLQTLGHVCLGVSDAARVKKLENLLQLTDLVLTINLLESEAERALCSLLDKLQNLEELYIVTLNDSHESIDLNTAATPMLRVLHAEGKLPCNFPTWIPGLQCLVELKLMVSKLDADALQSLQKLSSLLFLEITHPYCGDTWHIKDNGFPNLKYLRLDTFSSLEFFNIDEGALPSLEKLVLYDIPMLKKIPVGFKHLENLQHLVVISSFQLDDAERRQIIPHVARVEGSIAACFGVPRRRLSAAVLSSLSPHYSLIPDHGSA